MQRKEVTLNDKKLRDETCTLCIDVQYLLRFTYAVIPMCKHVHALPCVSLRTLFVLHVSLTWEDVSVSVLHHVGLVSGIRSTLWSFSDTL